MVHLNFSIEGTNHKVVFRPTEMLYNELFEITKYNDWEKNDVSIRRIRKNFIIDIDNESISKEIFDLYVDIDPLKWITIINYLGGR